MVDLIDELYFKEKEKAHITYKKLTPVKCKALGGKLVHFNSIGFNHLIYRKEKKERERKDQLMRFRCLDLARKVLELTSTVQEKENSSTEVVVKMKKRREKIRKVVNTWAFIAIIHNKKVKVIVRQVGEGQLYFWSIIPFWYTTKHGDYVFRDFATGNLDED